MVQTWVTFKCDDLSRSEPVGGISDRKQEIRRRRHRKQKINTFARKLKTASASDKSAIAEKIRKLTPGAEIIIERLGLQEH